MKWMASRLGISKLAARASGRATKRPLSPVREAARRSPSLSPSGTEPFPRLPSPAPEASSSASADPHPGPTEPHPRATKPSRSSPEPAARATSNDSDSDSPTDSFGSSVVGDESASTTPTSPEPLDGADDMLTGQDHAGDLGDGPSEESIVTIGPAWIDAMDRSIELTQQYANAARGVNWSAAEYMEWVRAQEEDAEAQAALHRATRLLDEACGAATQAVHGLRQWRSGASSPRERRAQDEMLRELELRLLRTEALCLEGAQALEQLQIVGLDGNVAR